MNLLMDLARDGLRSLQSMASGNSSKKPMMGRCSYYSGDQHYFTDSSLPSYKEAATGLVMDRVFEFLDKIWLDPGSG